MLNGYDAYDLGWPVTPIFTFYISFHILVVGGHSVETSNSVDSLIIVSPVYGKHVPERGVVLSSDPL